MKKANFERINIIFPKQVAEKLRRIPVGSRSQLVAAAAEKVLEEKRKAGIYERLLELRKNQNPLPPGTIVKWVREDRGSH
ncbi:MAG: hypothetical protein A2126_00630 [Candidatus Woykebacteria bacterium GWB1_45_5]|uniref:Ribbon-helix-helix protein CopG domain-containing protein n=2 Tax=Candidatus Woykeibacteriota TaxID=1817899 RepID=A0A1G1W2J9_9BACT|nr:MAG: hypothetical protein A2113_00910 [Candidatus Woykebacteria bacterium GWA1_44_8]OGY24226.1 MAG: hypothetical protein A2126_00630 [Candidatus Woykebacteria bacterium GWB1_45_5]